MLDNHENPPPPSGNPELERIIAQLQRMHADQVIEELNNIQHEANQIKDKIDQNEEPLKMHKGQLPKSVDNPADKRSINNVTDAVKRMIVAVGQDVGLGARFDRIPEHSKNILTKLSSISNINDIKPENSLYLVEIIKRGIDGRLETTGGLISAFKSIEMLEHTDPYLYTQIANLLRSEANNLGASSGDQEKLMTKEQKKEGKNKILTEEQKEKHKEVIEELDKNTHDLRDNIRTVIESIDINAIKNSDIARNIRERATTPEAQEALFQDELRRIRIQLLIKLDNLNRTTGSSMDAKTRRGLTAQEKAREIIKANSVEGQITGRDLNANFADFENILNILSTQGVLPSGVYENLLRTTNLLKENSEILFDYHEKMMKEHQGTGRLFYLAENYITTWSPRDRELLQVLDNPEEFLKLSKRKEENGGYNGFAKPEDWQKFNRDVRNIFNTMFKGTAMNPKDFWQSTFSELKEGMVYKELTTALLKLGDDLRKDPEYGENRSNKFIEIKDVYAKYEEQSYEGSHFLGAGTLTTNKIVKDCLGKGIRALTFEMIDYKELTQHSHDVNALTEAGMGFQKLDEFSSRLRQEDVDRLIKNMPGLADAISLYNTNIAHITARAGRTIPVDFGRLFISDNNLDPIGLETLHQLRSLNKIQKRIDKGELTEDDVIRMVTFAAGLSKGVFGSYFGAVGNNHIAVEVIEKERDPDHPDDPRPFWETVVPGKSSSGRATEQMLAQLDPDQNMVKFNRPRPWPEIRYAYSPRNIRGYKANKQDYWRNHGKIFDFHREGESAIVNGACNEYIDFTVDHIFLKDTMKTLIVDLGERSGWRHYDYRSKLFYQDLIPGSNKETRKVDFHKTIMKLQGVGEEAIRVFIDDLFSGKGDYRKDPSELSIEDIGIDLIQENKEYLSNKDFKNPGWKVGEKLNDAQKKAFQILLYDKYVFQHIRHTKPSMFIAMETREVIPEDEVRGTRRKDGGYDKGFTFHDQLMDYLFIKYENILPGDPNKIRAWIATHLLPMYTSALQVTEQNERDKKYDVWKENEEKGIVDPDRDPFDTNVIANRFSVAAFDDKKNRESLISFYAGYRNSIGKTAEGKNINMLNDEQFIENLKGFYRKMEEVIEKERWDHNTEKNKFGDWVHDSKKHKKETLTQRYSKLLKAKRAGVGSYLGWNCLNLDEFYFQTSGNRMTQRAFSEAALWVEKGTPMIETILLEKLQGFTKKVVNNDTELEESIKHFFVENFAQLNKVIANIDDDISYDYNGNFIMALVSALQDDRVLRLGLVGPMAKGLARRGGKLQSSFITDKIPETDRQRATSLKTSSDVEIFIRTIADEGVGLPREKNQIIGHGPPRFFGLIAGKNIYATGSDVHLSTEQLVNEAQVGTGIRLGENALMPVPILLFILALLAKLAFDKDNKK